MFVCILFSFQRSGAWLSSRRLEITFHLHASLYYHRGQHVSRSYFIFRAISRAMFLLLETGVNGITEARFFIALFHI